MALSRTGEEEAWEALVDMELHRVLDDKKCKRLAHQSSGGCRGLT